MMNEVIMWELIGEEMINYNDEQGLLPPGFRFHPTDEELVTFYLASKVFDGGFCGLNIVEVDLNSCEPWDLPGMAKLGEKEWYFFSLRDRKYPIGLRTNRATSAGYWKATGKDREVHATANGMLVGMKKTLVFYKGRAPHGEKTKWVLHEYRLEGDYSCRHTCKEEWVICRIFNKSEGLVAGHKKDQYYPNQTCNMDPSPPSLSKFQTLETPIQSLLQRNSNPLILNHDPLDPLFKNELGPPQNPQQEDVLSNWLEVYLQQNPGLYELAFGGQLPFGAGLGPLVP